MENTRASSWGPRIKSPQALQPVVPRKSATYTAGAPHARGAGRSGGGAGGAAPSPGSDFAPIACKLTLLAAALLFPEETVAFLQQRRARARVAVATRPARVGVPVGAGVDYLSPGPAVL